MSSDTERAPDGGNGGPPGMSDNTPAAPGEFRPYVPASQEPRELTIRGAIIGSILGILFGASSVYLALKVGLTVSASIPIAVLSIPIFRLLGKGSILENNIVQTTGSAGESIAAGVAFTVPALLIMGYDLNLGRSTLIALTGGWLGVMLMIPLRRSLIVKEHGVLPYPEGTACAEVLEAGERRGVQARAVFIGLIVGAFYKFFYKVLGLWKEEPGHTFKSYKGGYVGVEASPELLGVGYIIGPKIAGTMAAGGVLSYLVLIPMVKYFGSGLPGVEEMSPGDVRGAYVFYIGIGAVATGGIISLVRAIPTIVTTFGAAIRGLTRSGVQHASVLRTERDMPVGLTVGGVLAIAAIVSLIPGLHVNLASAGLIVVFGFFFSTVSSRICGQIGSSSNPISGMTIATLLLTTLIFVLAGWTGKAFRPIVLTVGAIVCVAAANAGATSQDLKTGFLLGATPRRQQVALLIGVTTSALVVGWTLYFINHAYTNVVDERVAHPALYSHIDVPSDAPTKKGPDGKEYRVVHLDADVDKGIPAGKVMVDSDGRVAYSINPGIVVGGREKLKTDDMGRPIQKVEDGKPKFKKSGEPEWVPSPDRFDAPKAQLMALIVDGGLSGTLPWALVLFGVFISLCLELAGIEALAFAVGLYLPISSSTPIFVGGVVRWVVDKAVKSKEGDTGRGVLLSSGLIAGGSLCGLLAAGLAVKFGAEGLSLAKSGFLHNLAQSDYFSLTLFLLLGCFLAWQALSGALSRAPLLWLLLALLGAVEAALGLMSVAYGAGLGWISLLGGGLMAAVGYWRWRHTAHA